MINLTNTLAAVSLTITSSNLGLEDINLIFPKVFQTETPTLCSLLSEEQPKKIETVISEKKTVVAYHEMVSQRVQSSEFLNMSISERIDELKIKLALSPTNDGLVNETQLSYAIGRSILATTKKILANKSFQELPIEDQNKLIIINARSKGIFSRLLLSDYDDSRPLVSLFQFNGFYQEIFQRDNYGKRPFDRLYDLISRESLINIEEPNEFLSDLIDNLVRPANISQDFTQTCNVSALHHRLVIYNRPRYIRLIHELVTEGKARLSENPNSHNDEILLLNKSFSLNSPDARVFNQAQLVVMSSLADYVNGSQDFLVSMSNEDEQGSGTHQATTMFRKILWSDLTLELVPQDLTKVEVGSFLVIKTDTKGIAHATVFKGVYKDKALIFDPNCFMVHLLDGQVMEYGVDGVKGNIIDTAQGKLVEIPVSDLAKIATIYYKIDEVQNNASPAYYNSDLEKELINHAIETLSSKKASDDRKKLFNKIMLGTFIFGCVGLSKLIYEKIKEISKVKKLQSSKSNPT